MRKVAVRWDRDGRPVARLIDITLDSEFLDYLVPPYRNSTNQPRRPMAYDFKPAQLIDIDSITAPWFKAAKIALMIDGMLITVEIARLLWTGGILF